MLSEAACRYGPRLPAAQRREWLARGEYLSRVAAAETGQLTDLRGLLEVAAADPTCSLYVGKAMLRHGRPGEAVEVLERVPASSELYLQARYLLGHARFEAGDFGGALEAWAGAPEVELRALTPARLGALRRQQVSVPPSSQAEGHLLLEAEKLKIKLLGGPVDENDGEALGYIGLTLMPGGVTLEVDAKEGSVLPLYEFRCQNCGHRFEQLCTAGQAMVECPACGGDKVSRLLSTFSARSGGQSIGGSACGPCAGGSCATCH